MFLCYLMMMDCHSRGFVYIEYMKRIQWNLADAYGTKGMQKTITTQQTQNKTLVISGKYRITKNINIWTVSSYLAKTQNKEDISSRIR